jgi:hypothetical protein
MTNWRTGKNLGTDAPVEKMRQVKHLQRPPPRPFLRQLHVSAPVAVKLIPPAVAVAVTVTGAAVVPRQVAVPLVVSGALLMLTFTASETDQFGRSRTVEHMPVTIESAKNSVVFPGDAALWSAVAVAGRTVMPVMLQL